jgi:hypothetical protein
MLSHIRAIVVGISLLLFSGSLLACQAEAAEGPSPAAFASTAPGLSPPILLAQSWARPRPSGSTGQVRIPYGLIRLIVLGVMGAGGWLGSKLYR